MSWAAHIEHTAGGLALTFASPVSRLDMSADVAQHLASLLAVEARHRLQGVVAGLAETSVRENAHKSTARRRGAAGNLGNSKPPHRGALVNTGVLRARHGAADVIEAETLRDQRSLRVPHALQCDCDDCLHSDGGKHHV